MSLIMQWVLFLSAVYVFLVATGSSLVTVTG